MKKEILDSLTEDEKLISLIFNDLERLFYEREQAKWTGKRSKTIILKEIKALLINYKLA